MQLPPRTQALTRWGKESGGEVDRRFIEGPRSRTRELIQIIRIFFEFLRGMRVFHFVGPCITVFGSARFEEDNRYYEQARELGNALSRWGYTIMTGGGPGIMEAANRGAKEAGGRSVGCNIRLPREQVPNAYLDRWMEFEFFFVRKVVLLKYSHAFIALPGGYGTLDELFETATLVQTGKMMNFPIVLLGTEYWSPLIEFIRIRLLENKTISPGEEDIFFLTDSVTDTLRYLQERGMPQR